MANTCNTANSLEHIMVHPALRKATNMVPAAPWISAMAAINNMLTDGMTKDLLLVFEGEADGVRRYNGFVRTERLSSTHLPANFFKDELWDTQDVRFDSRIIFGTKSQDLISLISGRYRIRHICAVQVTER
jgi:hypothetical protein